MLKQKKHHHQGQTMMMTHSNIQIILVKKGDVVIKERKEIRLCKHCDSIICNPKTKHCPFCKEQV